MGEEDLRGRISAHKNIDKIKAQAIDSDIMPPGNLTGITESERIKINKWILQGSLINN